MPADLNVSTHAFYATRTSLFLVENPFPNISRDPGQWGERTWRHGEGTIKPLFGSGVDIVLDQIQLCILSGTGYKGTTQRYL